MRPGGVLNPGVVLTDDPQAHTRDLKSAPTVEDEVDRCVECGYCEPVCPSRDLTTTPRQRIALRREMALARERPATRRPWRARGGVRLRGRRHLRRRLHVPDGLPGAHQHRRSHQAPAHRACRTARAARMDLRGPALGGGDAGGLGRAEHDRGTARAGGDRSQPARPAGRRRRRAAAVGAGPARRRPPARAGRRVDVLDPPARRRTAEVVAFSACVGSIFGRSVEGPGVRPALERLCDGRHHAALPRRPPEPVLRHPMALEGDGRRRPHDGEPGAGVAVAGQPGRRLDVVCDASSCTEGLRESSPTRWPSPAARTATCGSSTPSRSWPARPARAAAGAEDPARSPCTPPVRPPASASTVTCTPSPPPWPRRRRPRVAGLLRLRRRPGLLHPELTAGDLGAGRGGGRGPTHAHASSNRTCELGMSRATGKDYRHVLELLAAGTAPAAGSAAARTGREHTRGVDTLAR